MKTLTRFFTLLNTLMMFFFTLFIYAGSPASVTTAPVVPAQVSVKAPLYSSKHDVQQTYHKKDKYQNKEKLQRKETQKRCRPADFEFHPVFDAHGQLIRHEYWDSKGMLRILIIFKSECGCWHETRFDEKGKIISEGEYASMPVYEKSDSSSAEETSKSDEGGSPSEEQNSSASSGSGTSLQNTNESFSSYAAQSDSGASTAGKWTQYQYGRKGTLVKVVVLYLAKHMQCEYNGKGHLMVIVIFSPGKGLADKYDFQDGKPILHTCLDHDGNAVDEDLHHPAPDHISLLDSIPVRITVSINLNLNSGVRPSMHTDAVTPRNAPAMPTEAQSNISGKLNSASLSWKQMLQSRFTSEISDFQSMKEVLTKGDFDGKKKLKDAVTQKNPEKNHKVNALNAQVNESKAESKARSLSAKPHSLKEKDLRPSKIIHKTALPKPGIPGPKMDLSEGKEPQMQHKTDSLPVKLSPPLTKTFMKK